MPTLFKIKSMLISRFTHSILPNIIPNIKGKVKNIEKYFRAILIDG